MITTERQLATREFSDKQILTRIEAAKGPGFGLERATKAQLNMIYLLARHYDVDPAIDITLYRDRPWFTIDGRIRLMKRHPQYAGYRCRPLPGPEKEAWGYHVDDLVVECTIRTKDWGEISARGKVSAVEQIAKAPTGTHPSEMAEKRAIARASRLAFGQDVPDEDEAGAVIIERDDPARVAANAAAYDKVFDVDISTGEVLEEKPGADWAWSEHRKLEARALELGLPVKTLNNRSKPEEIAAANLELVQRIRDIELDQKLAKESV